MSKNRHPAASEARAQDPDPVQPLRGSQDDKKMICWCVTDGSAGTVAQVKALAAALGVTPVMKQVTIKVPFVWLPNSCYEGSFSRVLARAMHSFDAFSAPWPDVVISCGRRGAQAALGLKNIIPSPWKGEGQGGGQSPAADPHLNPPPSRGRTFFVHIQDPRMEAKHFDLIVAMEHDAITGDNVIKTPFALHAITKEKLAEAEKQFAKRFSLYPKPYVAVLLGGSTNKYKLNAKAMASITKSLQQLTNTMQGSLLITPSRRTGDANTKQLLAAFPRARDSRVYVYDGVGDNPYLGMLAMANTIIVTNDSVNMMSEAAATGKPLYILPLPGHKDTKPARFAEKLVSSGVARLLSDKLESWSYPASGNMEQLAKDVKQRLQLSS